MKRCRRHGQAALEAALGIVVFITILLFGIHFAEVGHLSLKVQEATNSAMWDATSQQMHDVTAHEWLDYRTAVDFAQTQAQTRYEDFDALKNGATTITQVMTRARGLTVSCTADVAGQIQPLDADPLAQVTYPPGNHGISCQSSANIFGFRIPHSFLDGNLFKASHFRTVTIPACAVGRPSGGACPGRLEMLLDDWGYSGTEEARECALAWEGGTACANQGYYDQVKAVYDGTPAANMGSASRLANVVAGTSPIDEDFFYLSFRGSESPYGPYTETVVHSHGDVYWETTPFQHPFNNRYDYARTSCWLGGVCQ